MAWGKLRGLGLGSIWGLIVTQKPPGTHGTVEIMALISRVITASVASLEEMTRSTLEKVEFARLTNKFMSIIQDHPYGSLKQ